MCVDPAQERVTSTRLIPGIDALLQNLRGHRDAVDREFHRRGPASPGDFPVAVGEPTLATYPIGFCREIRDRVWERALADPAFRALVGGEVILKKVFVLLKGQYFQNAVQLGNLYVDVANDTVWIDKPKLEWAPVTEVVFENADTWPRFNDVARRYLQVELYPNRLFPLGFPAAPFFAIRPSGRIDLFFAQDILFLKDVAEGMRRAHEVLVDATFTTRRLPRAYEELVGRACSGNLLAAFPLEFAPSEAAALRDGPVAEFVALGQQPPQRALATIQQYLRLMSEATRRLTHLNLIPSAAELAALRESGAIPPAP
jgi:hypothetical protein